MRAVACLLGLGALLCGAQPPAKHRILFKRFRVPEFGLFIAEADGKNERRLVPHSEGEYSPSLSLNGAWVVFTCEHMGQADIYRVHPDGTSVDQLTNDPACDDQAALSPDGGCGIRTRSQNLPPELEPTSVSRPVPRVAQTPRC
jgi:hypothetical protein